MCIPPNEHFDFLSTKLKLQKLSAFHRKPESVQGMQTLSEKSFVSLKTQLSVRRLLVFLQNAYYIMLIKNQIRISPNLTLFTYFHLRISETWWLSKLNLGHNFFWLPDELLRISSKLLRKQALIRSYSSQSLIGY